MIEQPVGDYAVGTPTTGIRRIHSHSPSQNPGVVRPAPQAIGRSVRHSQPATRVRVKRRLVGRSAGWQVRPWSPLGRRCAADEGGGRGGGGGERSREIAVVVVGWCGGGWWWDPAGGVLTGWPPRLEQQEGQMAYGQRG